MKRFFRFLLLFVAAAATSALLKELFRRWLNPPHYPTAETLLRNPYVDAIVTQREEGGVEIRWEPSADSVTVYSSTSPDNISHDFPLATVNDAYSLTVADNQQPRYFELVFTGGTNDGLSLIVAERELKLTGAVNFRDVGGYKTKDGRYVRWGRVYRAGQLANLSPEDHELLQKLQLKRSCDLRLDEELEEAPDNLPDGVKLDHMPVKSEETRSEQIRRLLRAQGHMDEFMLSAYKNVIVDGNPTVFARFFQLIADEKNLPLVIHCTAGKDRTGVAIAMLLSMLGVPDDVIAADYSLSNIYFDTYVELGADAIKSLGRIGLNVQTMLPLFTANPDVILKTLEHIRSKYGSVEHYLIDMGGLNDETLAKVKETMLR